MRDRNLTSRLTRATRATVGQPPRSTAARGDFQRLRLAELRPRPPLTRAARTREREGHRRGRAASLTSPAAVSRRGARAHPARARFGEG
eukprot:30944-Pelagococcus_subviridis.AAC.6